MSMKHATGRLGRWALLLSNYRFKIVHTNGTENVLADTLSRVKLPASGTAPDDAWYDALMPIEIDTVDSTEQCEAKGEYWEVNFVHTRQSHRQEGEQTDEQTDGPTQELSQDAEGQQVDTYIDIEAEYDVEALQRTCPDCRPLFDYIEQGVLPSDNVKARKLIFEAERYIIVENKLWHMHEPRRKRQELVDGVVRQLTVPQSLR